MGYIVHWKDGTSSEMDDKQFENMPREMEGEIGRVEQATTPDGFTDKVTSSPMSAAELEQFYKENPDLREELLKYAPGLPSVQSMPNREEGTGPGVLDVVKQIPGNVYQGVRDILAKDVGGPLGSLVRGMDEYTSVPDTTSPTGYRAVTRMPGSNYFERVAADQPGEIERGQRGEGLPGLLSDPMNLSMAIPVAGEARIASLLGKLPKYGNEAASLALRHPVITTGIASGITNAGLAAGSAAIDPLNSLQGSATDVTRAGLSPLKAAMIGGGLGLGAGVIGRGLTESAIENYPGAQKLENMMMGGTKNTGMVDLSRPERIRAYEAATSRSTIPTRRDFFDAAMDIRKVAGSDMDRVGGVFDSYRELGYPYGYIHTDDLGDVMRQNIYNEASPGGSLSTAVTEGDIDAYLNPIIEANALTAKLGKAPEPQNLGRARSTAAMSDRMGDLVTESSNRKAHEVVRKMTETDKHFPVSELGRTLGTLNLRIGNMLSKNPSAESKMALAAHQGIVDEILSSSGKNIASLPMSKAPAHLRDLSNKELAAYLRDRYASSEAGLFPGNNADVIREINALEQLRTPLADVPPAGAAFNDFLEPNTRSDYGFGSKMLKAVNRQADAGASMRVGMPLEFLPHFYTKVGSTYGLQGAKYKIGKELAENPLIASKLAQGLGSFMAASRVINEARNDRKGK